MGQRPLCMPDPFELEDLDLGDTPEDEDLGEQELAELQRRINARTPGQGRLAINVLAELRQHRMAREAGRR